MAVGTPPTGPTAAPDTIPVIDHAPHLADAPGALERAAAELRDALEECLPTCHGPGHPARHVPITYGDYIAWFTGQNYHGEDTAPPPS